MKEPLESAELAAFAATVDAKSLTKGAAALAIPRATLSRRLARLEERLGARLLRRTTRSLTLTDAGEALYRHARLVLDALEQAEASVRRNDDDVRGNLRVSVPPLTDASFFAMLCDFTTRYPRVRLQVNFATRRVDLLREGYDVALRASGDLAPGLVGRVLERTKLVGVASPDYLARRGVPRTRRDLRHHNCFTMFDQNDVPQTHWRTRSGPAVVAGNLVANEMSLLRHAAVGGLGIAFVPRILVEAELADGTLTPVLPGVLEMENRLAVVYAERELVPPQVRVFVDAVVAWYEGLTRAGLSLRPRPRSRC